jgi:protease I
MPNIRDARFLILAANGFEQSELMTPRDELRKVGAKVDVATPDGKKIRGWKMTDWGDMVDADLKIADAKPADYDMLVLPGGQINPDLLRVNPDAMKIVRTFVESGKPIAAICHGPWLLVEADALRGKTVTSYKSIKTDVKNAGANWVDQEVVFDGGIITSRNPDDLKAFVGKIKEVIESGQSPQRRVA